MFFKDRVSQWGMYVLTWLLVLLTLPFFYNSVKHHKETDNLTSCGKMCYPNLVLEDKPNRCLCQPQIR